MTETPIVHPPVTARLGSGGTVPDEGAVRGYSPVRAETRPVPTAVTRSS